MCLFWVRFGDEWCIHRTNLREVYHFGMQGTVLANLVANEMGRVSTLLVTTQFQHLKYITHAHPLMLLPYIDSESIDVLESIHCYWFDLASIHSLHGFIGQYWRVRLWHLFSQIDNGLCTNVPDEVNFPVKKVTRGRRWCWPMVQG